MCGVPARRGWDDGMDGVLGEAACESVGKATSVSKVEKPSEVELDMAV